MPATFELVFFALLIASLIGIPLGLYVGLNSDASLSRAIMTGSSSVFHPQFLERDDADPAAFGVVAVAANFGAGRNDRPAWHTCQLPDLDGIQHLIMPVLNLAIPTPP
jgi:peptide/nickel transport system permease protein